MHGEKHIDRYPHRTSPMDKYKHEFKKSKSRLLLENTIPLSPCSFLVALFNIERSSILLRSDRTLSRLDDKRLHVCAPMCGGSWVGAARRWPLAASPLARAYSRLVSLAQIGELARRLDGLAQGHNRSFFLWQQTLSRFSTPSSWVGKPVRNSVQCLYEDLMSNNFRKWVCCSQASKMAVLKIYINC